MKSGPLTQSLQEAGGALSSSDVEVALRLESGRNDIALRRRVANAWMWLFTLNVVGVMAAIFLVGLGVMALSTTVQVSLIGETLAHAATMALTMTRYLFPGKGG
jgi:hypothetical protein